jgi:hypothetical protein
MCPKPIAHGRITAANIKFVIADAFSWTVPGRSGTIFASGLPHVPASGFGPFWRHLPGLVAGHRRTLPAGQPADVRHTAGLRRGQQARTSAGGWPASPGTARSIFIQKRDSRHNC